MNYCYKCKGRMMAVLNTWTYSGRTQNLKVYGKRSVNSVYVPFTGNLSERKKVLLEIGKSYLLTSQSKNEKRIVGVGKRLILVGFDQIFCFELCYV